MPKATTSSRNPASHAPNRVRRASGRGPLPSLLHRLGLSLPVPLSAPPTCNRDGHRDSKKRPIEEDPKVIHKGCYEVIGRADRILNEERQRSSDTIRQLTAVKEQLSAEKQQAIDDARQLKSEIQQAKQELELATTSFQHQGVQGDEQRFVLEVHAMALALTNKLWSRTEAHRNAYIPSQLQFPDVTQTSWPDNAGQHTALNSHPLPANHLSGTQDELAQFNTYSSIS
ncbi:hypothetical protein NUU61_001410 [Penicillium alfredii]|uniref:Uncharacterized protein n=1 Tax=Penicillium alfredii TaxID=1506179 RepID=A0A9W9KML6_9EURO|nr:uncharacterized protein NUU61_001410 [Penicillium alfredii]KAJ5111780.1 hypothetical protein NUU61_001410 [Penicillium alfredii]